ncbi:MAG: T9SS type A sorting domain-containing protein [Candidatus Eisenbacteria bacterium]|nr:T9SS type A sorting domain-containing protein [Candidatus Eisenbacteria bacterium]
MPTANRNRHINPLVAFLSLAIAMIFESSPVLAADPSPGNSTLPSRILLVGHDGTVPDPAGAFVVTIRDLANVPIPNAQVRIDFSNAPYLTLSTTQLDLGMTMSCSPPTVMATTNAQGVASFNIMGGIGNRPISGGAPLCFAVISASSSGGPFVVQGQRPAAAVDLNGYGGVDPDDLHLFLSDYENLRGYVDFDGSGQVTGADLSVMDEIIAAKRSTESGPLCEGGIGVPVIVQALNLTLTQEMTDCSNPPTPQFSTSTCGAAGTRTDWLCSVTLPGGTSFEDITGVEATIDIIGTPNVNLPGFFQFGAGQCHSGALTGIAANDNGGPGDPNCLTEGGAIDTRGGSSWARTSYSWPYPGTGAIDRAQILATNIVWPAGYDGVTCRYGSVAGGVTTPVLGFRIANTGPACATSTCGSPVAFVLRELRLSAASPRDPGLGLWCGVPNRAQYAAQSQPSTLIIRPIAGSNNVVFVNGVPPGLVLDAPVIAPSLSLAAPAPNPASDRTSIQFQLAIEGPVRVAIYDIAGRTVRVLADGMRSRGTHALTWDGRGEGGAPVRSGTYFCRLTAPGVALSKPLVWMR